MNTKRPALSGGSADIEIGLNAVIVSVTEDQPRLLTLPGSDPQRAARTVSGEPREALPFGPLDPGDHRTLELGLRSWVRELAGVELGYCEQLYTFGDRDRALRGDEDKRLVSVSYLALGREQPPKPPAHWTDWYGYLPWEDLRRGRPALLEQRVLPALAEWAARGSGEARLRRRERAEIAFGLRGSRWDPDRTLDRYELLYEAGLVYEAERDLEAGRRPSAPAGELRFEPSVGRAMPLDHRRIAATALGRLRAKIRYRPVVFELLAETFTLLSLQRVVEALSGVELHKQNFRRLVERGGLVEGTGLFDTSTGGRPAEFFRFRREVLRERPAPGVGLPGFGKGSTG